MNDDESFVAIVLHVGLLRDGGERVRQSKEAFTSQSNSHVHFTQGPSVYKQ